MEPKEQLLRLVGELERYHGITHWAVSMRIFKKGDFFRNLRKGDCQTKTYRRVMGWFSENWPSDLPWPDDIDRPKPSKSKTEAA